MANTMTIQQKNVTEYFEATFGPEFLPEYEYISIFLEAVAGSGKTTTIMYQIAALMGIEARIHRAVVACSVSFNTNIRDASKGKLTAMGSTVAAKTTNQMGRAILV